MAHSIYLSKLSHEDRDQLMQQLWNQQKGKCFITGKDIDIRLHHDHLDIDHVVPISSGAPDNPSNFALTFSDANRSKQAADLRLARVIWHFKNLAENLQKSENRNPNLTDILKENEGAKYNLHFYIEKDKVKYAFSDMGNHETHEQEIYTDKLSGEKYFFACLPIEYIHHDDKINPRSIGENVTKLLAEFFKQNPQLHIALGYIEDDGSGKSPVKLFDGQHKSAAQVLLGVKELAVRIFINPNKDRLTESNFNAGTTLRQVAFDKSIQRHLGSQLYFDKVQHYQKATNRNDSDYAFSEKVLINFYKGESREMKRYIIDSIKNYITMSDENKLREYIDMAGRSTDKPLSYSTVEKTFYSFFISNEPLETNLDHKLEEGKNPRDLEKKQIIRLMNIVADVILVDKFDFEIGCSRLENKVQKGEQIDWNHVVAYRMMKEEIIYGWLGYINQIISMYFASNGMLTYGKTNFFQEEFPEQLWTNIECFIRNLWNLPFWRSKELSSTIFGGKQPYSYWQNIFSTGKSVQGEDILGKAIDIREMILPLAIK